MDEIFKKIQDVEKFVNKREQYAVLEAIHGKEEIEQKEQEEELQLKIEKSKLIDTIDKIISEKKLNKITNEPEQMQNHLLALRGILHLTNINTIEEKYVDIEEKRYLLYNDLKNRTPEQNIEMQKCYENLQTLKNNEKNIMEEKNSDIKNEGKNKVRSKQKENFFARIKAFFMNRFGKRKRLNEINKEAKKEDYIETRKNVAPMVEQENDSDVNLDFSDIKNGVLVGKDKEKQNRNQELEKNLKEISNNGEKNEEEIFEKQKNIVEQNLRERVKVQQAVDRRVKYGNKYMTWKNGNITYVDMDDDKKENEENESDDKTQQNVR